MAQMLDWVYHGLHERKSIPELIWQRAKASTVEFKASARWNYKAGKETPEITDAVVKTVAAFLNTEGGTLLIGVATTARCRPRSRHRPAAAQGPGRLPELAHGIAAADRLGKPAVTHVRCGFGHLDGGVICRLDVTPSPKPVFAKVTGADKAFFVRMGNGSHELGKQEMLEYIGSHWQDAGNSLPIGDRVPPFSPGKRLIVLGAGASRAARCRSNPTPECQPPLNRDFFTQLQILRTKHASLVADVVKDVVGLFGPNFKLTLEDYFTQLEFLTNALSWGPKGGAYTSTELKKKRDRLAEHCPPCSRRQPMSLSGSPVVASSIVALWRICHPRTALSVSITTACSITHCGRTRVGSGQRGTVTPSSTRRGWLGTIVGRRQTAGLQRRHDPTPEAPRVPQLAASVDPQGLDHTKETPLPTEWHAAVLNRPAGMEQGRLSGARLRRPVETR